MISVSRQLLPKHLVGRFSIWVTWIQSASSMIRTHQRWNLQTTWTKLIELPTVFAAGEFAHVLRKKKPPDCLIWVEPFLLGRRPRPNYSFYEGPNLGDLCSSHHGEYTSYYLTLPCPWTFKVQAIWFQIRPDTVQQPMRWISHQYSCPAGIEQSHLHRESLADGFAHNPQGYLLARSIKKRQISHSTVFFVSRVWT